MAILIAAGLFTFNASRTYVKVDGIRYWHIDDDQMISMRYARNLVEGHGLVFNKGERVEGYTNFGWTLIMAAVHLLPLHESKFPLAMQFVNFILFSLLLWLIARAVTRIEGVPWYTLPLALITSTFCIDLIRWAVSGFETTLLTLLFTAATLGFMKDGEKNRVRILPYALLSLVPIVRSAAVAAWAGAAIIAIVASPLRRRTLVLLALSLLPIAVHLLFRYHYYGDLFPNTYYLKVYQVPGLLRRGILYTIFFLKNYGILLLLVTIGASLLRQRVALALVAATLIAVIYNLRVGGDIFGASRFFAYLVPLLLIVSLRTVYTVTKSHQSHAQLIVTVTLFGAVVSLTGVHHGHMLNIGNGIPKPHTRIAVWLKQHSSPSARIAVQAAGTLPYYSNRYIIDLLGKTDPHVAHTRGRKDDCPGHNKYDAKHSFSKKPDYLAVIGPASRIRILSREYRRVGEKESRRTFRTRSFIARVMWTKKYLSPYLDNEIAFRPSVDPIALLVSSQSSEFKRVSKWIHPSNPTTNSPPPRLPASPAPAPEPESR
jgi:arabinofuranosyltransferase